MAVFELKKGQEYNGSYASTDYPTLTSDWVGRVNLYAEYPGGDVIFAQDMVLSGDVLLLNLPLASILELDNGVYYLIAVITNPVLDVEITSMDYAIVTGFDIFSVPMTKLFINAGKIDSSAAGKETTKLFNTPDNMTLSKSWKGVDFIVEITSTFAVISGKAVDTEKITMTTNSAGYAECYVLKGFNYKVTSKVISMVMTVDTTGLDSFDLSTLIT